MMLVLKNPNLRSLMSPELWYAVGVMNVLRNYMGFGQVTVVTTGRLPAHVNKICCSGWFFDLRCDDLSQQQAVEWCGQACTMLGAQGFIFDLVRPFKTVRVIYAPNEFRSFSMKESDVHGDTTQLAKAT